MKNFQEWSKEQVNEGWFSKPEEESHELARQPANVDKIHRLATLLKLPAGIENNESLWMALYNVVSSWDERPEHMVTDTSLKTIWNALMQTPGQEQSKLNGIEAPFDILKKGFHKANISTSAQRYNSQKIRELKAQAQNPPANPNNPQQAPQNPQQAPMNPNNIINDFKNTPHGREAINQLKKLTNTLNRNPNANANEKQASVLLYQLIRMLS